LASEQLLVGVKQAMVLCVLHMQWQRCPNLLASEGVQTKSMQQGGHINTCKQLQAFLNKAILVKNSTARMHMGLHGNALFSVKLQQHTRPQSCKRSRLHWVL